MSIGDRIRQKREEFGMSQEDVGKLLKVNRSTVKRYESGETRRIPISTIRKLADILQTTPEYLLELEAGPVREEVLDQDVMVLARAMQKISPQKREIISKMIQAMSDIADEELKNP